MSGLSYLKPDQLFRQRERVLEADWVLFPPHWLANTLAYAMRCRIFPSLPSYHLGYNKIEMTRAFQALCPANVPETLMVRPDASGIEAVLDAFSFPLVVKEPRNSMGRGVHLAHSAMQLKALAANLDVLYVQEFLPIDRDLRVVWVGDSIVSAYWRSGGEGAFYHNVSKGGRASFEDIPPAGLELVRQLATALGIDHAGFDLAFVGGHPFLFEFNLLFGNEALNAAGIQLGPIIQDYLLRRSQQPPREPDRPLSAAG